MSGMAPDPVPPDAMAVCELVEPPPERFVLHRLPVRRLPAAALPRLEPLGDALLDVLGIGEDLDSTGALQRLQRTDDRGELHAVVGGVGLAAEQLPLTPAGAQER